MNINVTATGFLRFQIDNDHLVDDGVTTSTVTGQIEVGPQGVIIRFDDYSTKHEDAAGDVILIEVCPEDGHPKVCVWSDINIEDPCGTISLSAAHVANRRDFS